MLSYCYAPYLYLNHLVEGGKGNKDDKAEEALFMMDTVAPTEEDTFVETIGETGTEAPKGGKNDKNDAGESLCQFPFTSAILSLSFHLYCTGSLMGCPHRSVLLRF